MWKTKLNRQFLKILPGLKISGFLILWGTLFHSFTLSILLYGSLKSEHVLSSNRLTTLNQFLSENQILFAALSYASALLFFRDEIQRFWKERVHGFQDFARSFLRGIGFGAALMVALLFHRDYEFLGFTTQLNLNFLSSYAWILRSILMAIFVISTEFLVRVVLKKETLGVVGGRALEVLTLVFLYWIWFEPHLSELLTLVLLFATFSTFWTGAGFLSAFFILNHAIFGLNFFENEFLGILQFKALRASENNFLQNHYLQATFFAVLLFIHYTQFKLRKESTAS